jgi:hypothetical protein
MKKPTNYTIQSPNATAVNILRAWLRAVGVPVRTSTEDGFDLTVTNILDEDLEVKVAKRADETLSGAGIQVSAGAFTGKKLSAALAAFHTVTDEAGYDRSNPIDRGAEPRLNEKGNPRKLHYKDEEFLVAIRHTEFRRSPNPSEDRWKKYRSPMEKTAAAFLRHNFELCARHGLTNDDLLQYARCYVVNFCARYEIPESETTFFDNERKCHVYLRQRFNSDLRTILLKKERSTIPDAETVSISLFGKPDGDTEVSPDAEEERTDFDYIAKHCELDLTSASARRASATSKLESLLLSLPHDQRVELLRTAAANTSFDFTTRREAARRLRLHVESCTAALCQLPLADSGIEEDEELAGADALGAAE